MPKIILNQAIVEDNWVKVDPEAELPVSGKVLLPYPLWLSGDFDAGAFEAVAVWIPNDTVFDEQAEKLTGLPVIAIDFPAFTDGRGYTLARQLRERFNYNGELRAIGDVLQDQLFYMTRCGFNSFAVREDKSIEEALQGLKPFSGAYQAALDKPQPLFAERWN
ncbi:DUF934 domain-containing protein [Oceanospirillum linum]|uniref:Oxidoreductase n=1 Tax=Oceanospirillum linum TaxID=966 RepID=A0A1T1HAN0_OCELI|nr:DUF934 domain-containing protein [Oceanospirillum linum]OOV86909.1 hypothetical protein BTA35_0211480 [Oceanospirillum linum]SEG19169.1 Uncharacterized conserved protein, DUF934 family [Oleiphilus messinensis]SMP24193.1 Uncharacterized conserved protein, DUF934 family [Oceanospirillum linum]